MPRSVLLLLCWKLPEYSPEKRPLYTTNLRKNLFPQNMSVKKWFQTEISLLPGDLVLRFLLACPLWKDAVAYRKRSGFAKQSDIFIKKTSWKISSLFLIFGDIQMMNEINKCLNLFPYGTGHHNSQLSFQLRL